MAIQLRYINETRSRRTFDFDDAPGGSRSKFVLHLTLVQAPVLHLGVKDAQGVSLHLPRLNTTATTLPHFCKTDVGCKIDNCIWHSTPSASI